MWFSNLIFSSSIFLVSSKFTLSEDNFTQLQNCLSKIQHIYDVAEFTFYINYNKKYKHLQLAPLPVIINHKLKPLKYFQKFKATFYIIIPNGSLDDTFFNLTQTYHWNPRAKFVIVLDLLDESIFVVAQKYYVFNIVVLIPTDSGIEIFSYFPYESLTSAVLVDEYVDGSFNNSSNLFFEKLPKSWSNTTVRTIAFTYPPFVFNRSGLIYGMEIEILKLMQSFEKFNIVYVKKQYVNWGRKLKNGSYEGAYADFRNYQVDLGIGMFFANINDNWDFDETYPYMEDTVKWTVPMAKLQERWQRVLGIFSSEIWLLIFAFFVWFCGLLLLMGFIVNEHRYRRIWDCLTICYQCFLGQAVDLPKAGVLRIALGFWVFFALLMTATFQGRLISVLNTNIREPQITNVEELIASKIKFGFYPDTAYLFLQPDNKIEWYIYNNYQECPVDSQCLNRVAFDGDFATFKTKKYIEHKISTSYLDHFGNSLIYVLDSTVFEVLITMVFVRGFPMYERVNLLLMRLKSAGFVEHTYKKAAFYAEKAMQSAKKTTFVFQVITMDEVFWMFCVLLIGLSFSLVVFVGEVCLNKWRQRVRTRGWVA